MESSQQHEASINKQQSSQTYHHHAGTSKSQLCNAIQEVRGAGSVDSAMGDQQFEALSKYGQDLTAKAARLDPVIGRDEEIRRSVRILCRRTKNNPVLIGEPGESLISLQALTIPRNLLYQSILSSTT